MKNLFCLCLVLLLVVPALAQESPVLTPDGLEEFKLGSRPPTASAFPGLTAQRVHKTESQEGTEVEVVYLKFYLHGHYLGKGTLEQGLLNEITIVDPRVNYEGGFSVGSSWDEIQRVFPGPHLHYTYVSDRLFADSEYQAGVQVEFPQSGYTGKAPLQGEFQSLAEGDLKADSQAQAIRIFKL